MAARFFCCYDVTFDTGLPFSSSCNHGDKQKLVGYGSTVAGKENEVFEVPPRIDEPWKSKKCAGDNS